MSTQVPSTPPPQSSQEKNDRKERKSKYKFKSDSLSKAKTATEGIPTEASCNVPGKPLVDFFIFAQLPAEIQDEVWESACFQDPAVISIIVDYSTVRMIGPLPKIPSLLHATSGARGIGLRYFEVLTSFDSFRREPRLPGLNHGAANFVPALVQAGPGIGNMNGPAFPAIAQNAFFPMPAPLPAATTNAVGTIAGVMGQTNQAAQTVGQFGPGHVLGTAGNNTNNVPLTNQPTPPTLSSLGEALTGTYEAPTPDKDKVILMGAFPVLAGNIVGYCDEPDPKHPFLPVKIKRSVLPGKPGCRKFYVNMSSAKFKLQIGETLQYNYPTFSLAEESSVTCVKNSILTASQRKEEISALLEDYDVLPAFPALGKLPSLFKKIENLVLNISLPPCDNPNEYSAWAAKSARSFLSSLHIRSTVRRFPNLRSLDFYVPGDHKINPSADMTLKHWRDVVIRDSNGITLSRSQMALLEMIMADEMRAIRREVDKDDFPASRLLVYVPQKTDRMEFDANFAD